MAKIRIIFLLHIVCRAFSLIGCIFYGLAGIPMSHKHTQIASPQITDTPFIKMMNTAAIPLTNSRHEKALVGVTAFGSEVKGEVTASLGVIASLDDTDSVGSSFTVSGFKSSLTDWLRTIIDALDVLCFLCVHDGSHGEEGEELTPLHELRAILHGFVYL